MKAKDIVLLPVYVLLVPMMMVAIASALVIQIAVRKVRG